MCGVRNAELGMRNFETEMTYSEFRIHNSELRYCFTS